MNPQEPATPNDIDSPSTTAVDEAGGPAPAKPRRPRTRKTAIEPLPEGDLGQPAFEPGTDESSLTRPQTAVDAATEVAPVAATRPRRRNKPSPVEASASMESVSLANEPLQQQEGAREESVAQNSAAAPVANGDGRSFEGGDYDDDDDDDVKADPIERPQPMEVGEVFAQVLSGEFDVEPPAEAAAPSGPPKRVLLPDPDAPKLHKVLAQAGVGSRRDMEQMIVDGLITVNGQPAHTGQRISFGDQIKVDGKPIRVSIVPPAPRIIAYHKPAGEVVTHDDPQHRPTVFRRLPRLPRGKWQSVGRLDLNTEGLLLFTNSGELANQLMHPRFGVEREYAVRVLGTLESEAKAKLLEGVDIEGQIAGFKTVEEGGGDGANRWYRVVITEGRNREVRKLFEAVGLTVSRLIRIRYGTVVLPRGLKRGVWVDLAPEDVQTVRQLAGGGAPRKGRDARDSRNNNNSNHGNNNNRRNKPLRGNEGPRRNNNQLPAPERFVERAASKQTVSPRNEDGEDDFDPRQIPNPLEQTFDKRFVQNPRTPAGGRGFRHGGGGFGSGGSGPAPMPPKKGGGPREPDPLQTSVGYIGADAFHRKNRSGGGGGGGGGRSGGNRGGGGGGYGGKRGR